MTTPVFSRACALALVAALAATSPALACDEAVRWSERTVCQYQELQDEDRRFRGRMSHLLRLVSSDDRRLLRAEQGAWELLRDSCRAEAKPVSCLKRRYQDRLAELERHAGREMDALRNKDKGQPTVAAGGLGQSLARLKPSSLDRN